MSVSDFETDFESRSRSPTSIPLPSSPSPTSELQPHSIDASLRNPQTNAEFEALINLLATSDDDDHGGGFNNDVKQQAPAALPAPNARTGQQQPNNLRDADGRFDFSKIRSFFENPTPARVGVPKQTIDLSASVPSRLTGDIFTSFESNNPHPLAQSTATSQKPSNADSTGQSNFLEFSDGLRRSTPQPSEDRNSPLSHPPKDINNLFTKNPPPVASTSLPFTNSDTSRNFKSPFSVYQRSPARPSSAPTVPPSEADLSPLRLKSRQKERNFNADLIELATGDDNKVQTDALTKALTLANQEVANLRARCNELIDLVSEVGLDHRTQTLQTLSKGKKGLEGGGSEAEDSGGNDGDMVNLILSTLHLPPSALEDLQSSSYPESAPHLSPNSFADIQRAISFLRTVDELVWRRSIREPPTHGGVFGEENVMALEDRVSLWERAVRTRR